MIRWMKYKFSRMAGYYWGAYKMLSSDGNEYSWDKSKNEEYATIFWYSLIEAGENKAEANILEEECRMRDWPEAIEEILIEPKHNFHSTRERSKPLRE